MRPTLTLEVARKEILSTLRDRRALISNLLIPLLLLPALMLGLPLVIGGLVDREQGTDTALAVENLAALPEALRQATLAQNATLEGVDDAARAVRDDRVDAALIVPPEAGSAEMPTFTIVSKRGSIGSELAASKLRNALESYRTQLVEAGLVDAGVDPAVLQPIEVRTLDASSPAEQSSGQMAWMIPFFIAIWTLTGGQMAAVDATAGEKERGTLESLLVAPVRRTEVVVGKFLATLTFGLSAATMAILGVMVGGVLLRTMFVPRLGDEAREMVGAMGGSLTLSVEAFWLLLGSALLLAAAVAALLIAISLFARSFKEAQSYLAPLSFVMILPALSLQFRDLLAWGDEVYLIPLVNVMVLIDDIVGGGGEPLAILLTWSSMLVVVALLLTFAWWNFRREGVIFRT